MSSAQPVHPDASAAPPGTEFRSGQTVRSTRESIHALPEFSSLALQVIASAADPRNAREGFAAGLEGECVACGIRLTGGELLLLGSSTEGSANPKLERLRMGYCARRTCDSRFYRLTCTARPGVDWEMVFAVKDGLVSLPRESLEATATPSLPLTKKQMLIGAAIALLFLVAAAFQFYAGGTIPLIRQAETFEVDSTPDPADLHSRPASHLPQ